MSTRRKRLHSVRYFFDLLITIINYSESIFHRSDKYFQTILIDCTVPIYKLCAKYQVLVVPICWDVPGRRMKTTFREKWVWNLKNDRNANTNFDLIARSLRDKVRVTFRTSSKAQKSHGKCALPTLGLEEVTLLINVGVYITCSLLIVAVQLSQLFF